MPTYSMSNSRDLCTTYCAPEIRFCDSGYRARGTVVQVRFSNRTSSARYSCAEVSSIVSRRRVACSAAARQGEGNNDTIALEMELRVGAVYFLPLAPV